MGKKQDSSNRPASQTGEGRSNGGCSGIASDGHSLVHTAAKAVAAVALGVVGVLSLARRRPRIDISMPEPEAREQQSDSRPEEQAQSAPAEIAPPPARQADDNAIALRAYYLSEERRAVGLPADPRRDWLDAERELSRGLSVPNAS